jgi:hypothetical protein
MEEIPINSVGISPISHLCVYPALIDAVQYIPGVRVVAMGMLKAQGLCFSKFLF